MIRNNYIKKISLPNDLIQSPISEGWDLSTWKNEFSRILSSSQKFDYKRTKNLSKKIIRFFSSNFYTISRILPQKKRSDVECVYATVRYPDEIVDTFNLNSEEKLDLLKNWEKDYFNSLKTFSFTESMSVTENPIISYFRELIINHSIPENYYPNYLKSMREDLNPKIYKDFDDLINNYIFGSAIIVGYLLTYAYGHSKSSDISSALKTSKSLAIALQLTNFARDIKDDFNRQRCYAPLTVVQKLYNKNKQELTIKNQHEMRFIQLAMANEAEKYYKETWKGINNFSTESIPAISACTKVFQKLNQKIIIDKNSVNNRCSLSFYKKIKSIPLRHTLKISLIYLFETIKK